MTGNLLNESKTEYLFSRVRRSGCTTEECGCTNAECGCTTAECGCTTDECGYTTVECAGAAFGGGKFSVIAGPCSVEEGDITLEIAKRVRECGAAAFRAGAYKPRTSPYSFDGLHERGLPVLSQIKNEVSLPIVTELTSKEFLPLYGDVDFIQIGARNMQNFELLKAVGKINKPVILKRGMGATIEELLLSAEYILKEGNERVILCERGIRTFEGSTRYTLDISAVPVLKRLTHLPVIVDPSHAAGDRALVPSLTLAAVAAGADGLMLEVHTEPSKSVSDPCQALSCEEFASLMKKIEGVRRALNG